MCDKCIVLTSAVLISYPEDFPNYLPSLGHKILVDSQNKKVLPLYGESVMAYDNESAGYFPLNCLKVLYD